MKKLRTTTPASISKNAKRGVIFFAAFAMIVASSAIYLQTNNVFADEYSQLTDKIRALEQDKSRYEAEARRLNDEAMTLANTLAQLNNEKSAIQAQVDVSQAKHDKLIIEIADTEVKIKESQDLLGKMLADLYVGDSISPVEMLASSQNIGDFLDKQEYRNSAKDQLNDMINKVKTLKSQLTDQKDDVAKVLVQQKNARDALAEKEAEQATLLASTRNEEAGFQGLIKESQAEIDKARATQADISNRFNSGGAVLVDVGGSEYPWNASNCPMVGMFSTGGVNYPYGGRPASVGQDGWGYGCRQCASYVAWKIFKETGNWYKWGDAKDFTSKARAAGYRYLGTNPEAGSIAVMDPAKAGQMYGHVAWVESVSGRTVTITQYNANINGIGYGMFTRVDVDKSSFDHYVKITP